MWNIPLGFRSMKMQCGSPLHFRFPQKRVTLVIGVRRGDTGLRLDRFTHLTISAAFKETDDGAPVDSFVKLDDDFRLVATKRVSHAVDHLQLHALHVDLDAMNLGARFTQ